MAAQTSMRNLDVASALSPSVRMRDAPPTLALAHATISASSTLVPSFLSDASRSTVERRMSCHMTAKMSFLLPSAMSRPPIFTNTRSNSFLPTSTTRFPFSTRWWRFLGAAATFFHGTQPALMWSMTDRMGSPLHSSRNRSLTWTRSPVVRSVRLSELSQSLKVRASRVSPESSKSSSASSAICASSSGARPWQSLKSCAVKARLSLALPDATSRGLMNGSTPTDRAFDRTASARRSRSASLSLTRRGHRAEP
mmetsp:Transcript_19380/g.77179  ORF Transcript_19380/g.77179 Transcript_19380/m.77179 type:complete len:253 (+) Transcript_19380:314-1072(+)